jgi:hypothetical protein
MKLTSKRVRYRLASLLDRLPGQCWTDLVIWVEYAPDTPVENGGPWSPQTGTCRSDARQCGYCYCGKLERRPDGTIGRRKTWRKPWPLWGRVALLAALGVLTATLLASAAVLLAAAPLLLPRYALNDLAVDPTPDPRIGELDCHACIAAAAVEVLGDPAADVLVASEGLACGEHAAALVAAAVAEVRLGGSVQVVVADAMCPACWRPGGGHWPDCPIGGAHR